MPPAYEVLLLNTAIPQIQAAQSGDTYVVPRDIAINATAIISANSATDALRITQIGAGNAILVEDSANPDSSPFVVTAAGDVGAGTSSPAGKLSVNVDASTQLITFRDSSGRQIWAHEPGGNARPLTIKAQSLTYADDTTTRLTVDTSGNLGLGVTPSAWSGYKAFQFAVGSGFVASSDSAYRFFAGTNAFYNGTNWIYKASTLASLYEQGDSIHKWWIAPSGTAGNAISFTQAMTLDASGNLLIGATSGSGKLFVQGSIAMGFGYSIYSDSTSRKPIVTCNYDAGSNTDYTEIGSPAASGGVGTDIRFKTGAFASWAERARITSGGVFQVSSGGSVQVGGTAARATTAGTNRLDIFNGTAPVGTLTNGISIYSSSGEAYVMDAAGNATLFSPHDAETNEWIFKSKHTPTGKVLKIDVERLLKFVNDHFGLDAVHEFVEE